MKYDVLMSILPVSWIQYYGKEQLGVGTIPTVGSTYTVDVHPSCTVDDELSPGEMGLCTLVFSSYNLLSDISGTTATVCTLPTLSLPVVSTSLHSGEFV